MSDIQSDSLPIRMRAAVSLAWSLLSRKIGNGLIGINKEASLQLQFAYLLQQLLPLITFHHEEKLEVELETGARVGESTKEVDVIFTGRWGGGQHKIAIEMKCYRRLASSGKPRGAIDIFMKDVHDDLAILERYIEHKHAEEGVCLVMTDHKQLVAPDIVRVNAKCRNYEISDGVEVGPITLDIPIGGKDVFIVLKRRYQFNWTAFGNFYFLETEGVVVAEDQPASAGAETCEASAG